MNLLKALLMILSMWRPAFCKQAAFARAKELTFACLCACGQKTITSMAIFLGRGHKSFCHENIENTTARFWRSSRPTLFW